MSEKTKVVFLHRKGLSGAGSKIMRCDQLSEICTRYLNDKYDFSVVSQRPIRNAAALDRACEAVQDCIVIMLKGTPNKFGEEGMRQLSASARAVGIDYVDSNVSHSFSQYADFHISASRVGYRVLQEHMDDLGADAGRGRVVHLTHHADPRLANLHNVQQLEFAAGYLGHPNNVYLPDLVKDRVHILSYGKDRNFTDAFDALNRFNMHYCVRSLRQQKKAGSKVAKPFTKGFTAATLGANVMTLRESDDAVHYLGEDYPFFLETANEVEISAALDRAKDLFGTQVWVEALDRMAFVRAQVSLEKVAREMGGILSDFT